MKRIVFLLSLTTLSAPAIAADAVYADPAPMAPMAMEMGGWNGFYAGIQAGYGFGSTGTLQLTPFTPALQAAFAPGFSGNFRDNFVGGAHVGYDWQSGSVVYGGVLDLSFARLGDRQIGRSVTPATYTISRDIDLLVTARGRLGYAFSDQFLGYVTGGLAYGNVRFNYTQPGSGATFTTSGRQNSNFGYTVGGGLETKVTQKISVGFEYLYTNLGSNNFGATLNGGPFTPDTRLTGSDRNFDFHTITAKVSYRF